MPTLYKDKIKFLNPSSTTKEEFERRIRILDVWRKIDRVWWRESDSTKGIDEIDRDLRKIIEQFKDLEELVTWANPTVEGEVPEDIICAIKGLEEARENIRNFYGLPT
jgi:hypothetical protein